MNLLVTGSRSFTDRDMVYRTLDELHKRLKVTLLIEGCAEGADTLAEEWARECHVVNRHFPADWPRYGKSAGARRNSAMLADGEPEMVVAFHRDGSSGTADMIRKARNWGLEVIVVPSVTVVWA